ncbi:MAG: hypothetical protein LBF75_04780 [Treponema sp.]|jgi:hypothetical protein|nr:hypothetical protein [Treponema sp.]
MQYDNINLEIVAHFSDLEDRLNCINLNMSRMVKKMTGAVGRKMRREARDSLVRSGIKRRTGMLRDAITPYAFSDFGIELRSKKFYSSFLEHGVRFKHKSGGIPPRPFMQPVVDKYFGNSGRTGLALSIMEAELQKQLTLIWEKRTGQKYGGENGTVLDALKVRSTR